jgi:hypothetical protein
MRAMRKADGLALLSLLGIRAGWARDHVTSANDARASNDRLAPRYGCLFNFSGGWNSYGPSLEAVRLGMKSRRALRGRRLELARHMQRRPA